MINVRPNIVSVLLVNQNASVAHPIMPAVMDPSRVCFKIKYIENAIPKYHRPLKTNQVT